MNWDTRCGKADSGSARQEGQVQSSHRWIVHRWIVGGTLRSAWYSTSWGWWPIGIATPPMSMTRPSASARLLRWSNDHPGRHRPPPGQGRPSQRQDLPPWPVERAYDCGNRLFHDVGGVAHQNDASSGLGRLRSHLAYTISAFNILVHFNILVQWNGLQPDATGKVRLSIAQFTL